MATNIRVLFVRKDFVSAVSSLDISTPLSKSESEIIVEYMDFNTTILLKNVASVKLRQRRYINWHDFMNHYPNNLVICRVLEVMKYSTNNIWSNNEN